MIVSIIKNTIIFFMSIYTLYKLGHFQFKLSFFPVVPLLISLILSFETWLFKSFFDGASYIIPVFTLYVLLLLLFQIPPKKLFFLTLFSYSLNLLLFSLQLLFVTFVYVLLFEQTTTIHIEILTLIVCFLYPPLLFFLLKSPRHKAKLPMSDTFQRLVLFVFLITIIILTREQVTVTRFSILHIMSAFFISLAPILLILWWRAQITKSYREKLRILEMESLRASKRELSEYITTLESENERLGKINHKDNRIISALSDSVVEYLNTMDTMPLAESKAKATALANEILSIQADRQELLLAKPVALSKIPQTGHAGIDAIISYISKEATLNHISLQFHFQENFFEDGELCMTEPDMVHLLSDLLENAVIATKCAGGKNMELSMLKIKGTPTISLSDSGIPFDITTYMNFGLQKASTHLDDGGSGIGLMDIWSLKEKYRASLYIEEFTEDETYTKRISFLFDHKKRYIIASERAHDILSQHSRADLLVVDSLKDVPV